MLTYFHIWVKLQTSTIKGTTQPNMKICSFLHAGGTEIINFNIKGKVQFFIEPKKVQATVRYNGSK